jgi:ABC-type lipoprotein release transport system permease subunit
VCDARRRRTAAREDYKEERRWDGLHVRDVEFHISVTEILLVLMGAYAAKLVTTFLPSRAASRIAPAEALRYE